MKKRQKELLDSYPSHDDFMREYWREQGFVSEYIKGMFEDLIRTKNIDDFLIDLKPLIEAKYTICDFAKLCGLHRITLYKALSRKVVPRMETLNKIIAGLGDELGVQFGKI